MASENRLAERFTLPSLLRFVFPTIVMMVFLSMYTSVDGAFVSHLISEDALAAVNIVYPVLSLVLALGLMLATGGNAILGRLLGEGRPDEACSFFTLLYLVGIGMGVVFAVVCLAAIEPILGLLGAAPNLWEDARVYLSALVLFAPASFLQLFAQNFFVTEGRPGLGLGLSLAGGLANIVLDYVFMGLLHTGIAGAAVATGIGYLIPGLCGVVYFARGGHTLRFARPRWDGRAMLHTCTNGSSELINNLSVAITTLMFNLTMLRYVGSAGVAAITVILYLQFIQAAIYFGYSQGVAPVLSYRYGAGWHDQLAYLVRLSIRLLLGVSAAVVVLSWVFVDPAIGLFLSPDSPTWEMTRRGFLIFSFSYLFMGLNIFFSALFTALGNGRVSAILSFLRTLVFIVGALALLPPRLGLDGAWIAVPLAEALALVVGLWYYVTERKNYHY